MSATIAAAFTLAGLFLTIYGASHLMIWLHGRGVEKRIVEKTFTQIEIERIIQSSDATADEKRRNKMKVASHLEVVINYEAVASFQDRFDAAAFVRANGGFIRLITKQVARPVGWWVQQ